MAKTTIKSGQSWWDVGITLSGSWEAGIDLALERGLSMTQAPPLVEVATGRVYDPLMERHCHAEGIAPATLHSPEGELRSIFSKTFNSIFG